nr:MULTISPECIES: DUF3060 domain-containing protein [unclassified Mycobacterium]
MTQTIEHPDHTDTRLSPVPRRVPVAFWLAELLPLRWRYGWTLLLVGAAPIALWVQLPRAFAAAAVLTVVGIYAVQLRGARERLALLRWGRVATVTGVETASAATRYRYNVYLPVAHGWTVTRRRWSGPNIETTVNYQLDGRPGTLVVSGREYVDGVILADDRDPARACCVASFAYDLRRDAAGDWVGRLRPRLRAGMACWLAIVLAWLALAGVAATGARTEFGGSSPAAAVPQAGTLQVSGTGTVKTIPCHGGYLSVSGRLNTITVTGHCTSVSVSGDGNRVAVDSADAVSAAGTDNAVTYHWGAPKIVDAGTTNIVRQG